MSDEGRTESVEDYAMMLPLGMLSEIDDPILQAVLADRARLERQRSRARWWLSITGLALLPLIYVAVAMETDVSGLRSIALGCTVAWLTLVLLWRVYSQRATRRWTSRLEAWTVENVRIS